MGHGFSRINTDFLTQRRRDAEAQSFCFTLLAPVLGGGIRNKGSHGQTRIFSSFLSVGSAFIRVLFPNRAPAHSTFRFYLTLVVSWYILCAGGRGYATANRKGLSRPRALKCPRIWYMIIPVYMMPSRRKMSLACSMPGTLESRSSSCRRANHSISTVGHSLCQFCTWDIIGILSSVHLKQH